MMTLFAAVMLVVSTIPIVAIVVAASYLGVPMRHGSIYEKVQRLWGKALVAGGGVRIRVHRGEHMSQHDACVYVANHVSWYDVFCLAAVLPRWSFVAKQELRKIPIFGRGAEAVGTIFVERRSRKSATAMYEKAAVRINEGASVVVFAEGTRGDDYALRPFKKGSFILAMTAGVPIIPVVIMGTREVMPRGQWLVHRGTVNIHFLEPIPTAGLQHADRERLITQVWTAMANTMQAEYGVTSNRSNAISSEEPSELSTPTPPAGVVTQ